MMDSGELDRVIDMREDFQRVMAQRYKDTIDELTDRKVLAFISQAHVDPDTAPDGDTSRLEDLSHGRGIMPPICEDLAGRFHDDRAALGALEAPARLGRARVHLI